MYYLNYNAMPCHEVDIDLLLDILEQTQTDTLFQH